MKTTIKQVICLWRKPKKYQKPDRKASFQIQMNTTAKERQKNKKDKKPKTKKKHKRQ